MSFREKKGSCCIQLHVVKNSREHFLRDFSKSRYTKLIWYLESNKAVSYIRFGLTVQLF